MIIGYARVSTDGQSLEVQEQRGVQFGRKPKLSQS